MKARRRMLRTYIGQRANLYSFTQRPILVRISINIGSPADQYRFAPHTGSAGSRITIPSWCRRLALEGASARLVQASFPLGQPYAPAF